MLSLKFKKVSCLNPKEILPKANKYSIPQGMGQQEGKDTKEPAKGFKMFYVFYFFQISLNRVCAAKQTLKTGSEL